MILRSIEASSGFALAMSLVIDDYKLSNKVVIDDLAAL